MLRGSSLRSSLTSFKVEAWGGALAGAGGDAGVAAATGEARPSAVSKSRTLIGTSRFRHHGTESGEKRVQAEPNFPGPGPVLG